MNTPARIAVVRESAVVRDRLNLALVLIIRRSLRNIRGQRIRAEKRCDVGQTAEHPQ